jgi:enoyl-CoA hydratase/carnithine racemase
MSEFIRLAVEGSVARVTLNRPDRYNALSPDMFDGLIEVGKKLAALKQLRVVILSGAGGNFCSGIDVQELASAGDPLTLLEPSDDSPANRAQRAAWIWREVPVPVIAVLEGTVFGAGLQVALACDLRIATPDSRLSVMEIRWGIIPDMSITQTITRLTGDDVARELSYTGRELDGIEALRLGLVTRITEHPTLVAEDLAAQIAGRNPDAIRAMKSMFNQHWNSAPKDSLSEECRLQKTLLGSNNQMEAVMANMQKREPHFD